MEEIIKQVGPNNAELHCYTQYYGLQQERVAVRPAVLILAGGAYTYLSDRESEPVALAFMAAGYHAFLLKYTVNADPHLEDVNMAYQDVAAAMEEIRNNAREYRIDPQHIALLGFSAGGHLAAWYSCTAEEKPDALILGYACINQEMMDELEVKAPSVLNYVSADTPGTFLFGTCQDPHVPSLNTMQFACALAEHHVPYECHEFLTGKHGMSLGIYATSRADNEVNSDFAQWFAMCLRFLDHLWETDYSNGI